MGRVPILRSLQPHFIIDPPQQPVPEFVQEHREVFFAASDVGVFMVVFFAFGDIDVAVFDGAGGFKRVNEFDQRAGNFRGPGPFASPILQAVGDKPPG